MTDARAALPLVVAPEAMCSSLLACIGSNYAFTKFELYHPNLNWIKKNSSTVAESLTDARLALPLVVSPEAMCGSLLVRIGSKFYSFV